jgi:hypothetical protein
MVGKRGYMAIRTLIAILFSIGFCLSADLRITIGNPAGHQERPSPVPPRPPFRYAIIRDRTLEGTYYPEGGDFRVRHVDVLLDPKSFSEESLRQLVSLLSKRFADPKNLLISIYTSLDDVLTPEEAEYISPPDSVVDLRTPKYAWAFYIRNSDGEHFRYHTKEPGSIVKTVNLRDKIQ